MLNDTAAAGLPDWLAETAGIWKWAHAHAEGVKGAGDIVLFSCESASEAPVSGGSKARNARWAFQSRAADTN